MAHLDTGCSRTPGDATVDELGGRRYGSSIAIPTLPPDISAVMPTSTQTSSALQERYRQVRDFTRSICQPLQTEDYVIQTMPDVSPTRWHLAHTTWFFETFLLKPHVSGYQPFHAAFEYLFNSYYNAVGQQYPRAQRGLLSRPTVSEIWQYRDHVDHEVETVLAGKMLDSNSRLAEVVELGLQHEQQHQELMLTDIKHVLSCNPLRPCYGESGLDPALPTARIWQDFPGGEFTFGFRGDRFHFDNEGPAFRQILPNFQLQNRLVTNAEYLEFVRDGGYSRPELWLSMGWATVQEQAWSAPLYWVRQGKEWLQFTLHGLRELDLHEPVSHVSYFEADAMARWSDARLPTELEWEHAAAPLPVTGNFADTCRRFHPASPSPNDGSTPVDKTAHADAARHVHSSSIDLHARRSAKEGPLHQVFGDLWEWTSSPYTAYPGYQPVPGALGEYNGKFMCNQFVLRGGSCGTPQSHIRPTYRNFFPPDARWQFTGIRLAR